ncbi:hypothetical protein IT411_03735, partial [Candidatus Peregrinibacteria bacterium]|nr:hypothetical protein [Candidatus Peregrinibacteria bacterium]
YNVKQSFGNLKDGANSYKVYAVDSNGKKSAVLTVTINFDAPVVSAAPASSTTPTTSTTTTNQITEPATVTSSERPINTNSTQSH